MTDQGFNINQIARDKEKSRDGVWVDTGYANFKIKVVCLNDCMPYKEFMMSHGHPVRRARARNVPNIADLLKLQAEGCARHILKDWNLTDTKNGVEEKVPCNFANIMSAFEKAPDLIDIVVQEASDTTHFGITSAEELAEDSKNS